MGVSYLPFVSFTSWMIRGLRVTIPVPRGRKSLLQRKKRFGEGYAHAHAHKETHNFPILSSKLASLVQSMNTLQQCLLKVSRTQRPSEFRGFFSPKSSSSSAKNINRENSDIFDQYKNAYNDFRVGTEDAQNSNEQDKINPYASY